MPFEVVNGTTLMHSGPRDTSTCKVHLEDGTTVTCNGYWKSLFNWEANPDCRLAIHPDFVPKMLQDLIESERERFVIGVFKNLKRADEHSHNEQVKAMRESATHHISCVQLCWAVVGEELVATVGLTRVSLGRVVGLEGSA